MRLRVLIVEDEEALIEPLKYNFTKEGYIVDTALDGEIALDKIFNKPPELILLDWMLPKISGIDLCKRIRNNKETKNIPIIMLTARGEENDRIQGLEMGADDYLPKPFNPRELLARAKAVLRRRSSEAPGAPSKDVQIVEFGNYKLNLATREMTAGDTPLTLTSGEFAVLKSLVTHPREPLSRDKLMNLARGRDYSALERSIDVQVSRLRRMLEEDPANPRYIQTVWGLGYVFVPDGEQV